VPRALYSWRPGPYPFQVFIAETFTSLQGEGILVGVPSFFVRTSGCPLRCRWCDTPYTSWAPEGERRDVAALVEEACDSGCRHVVVTGGEPLIQREVGRLTRALRATGLHVTVETAGVHHPEFECDLLSVSPKTANSDPGGDAGVRHRRLRERTDVLAGLLGAHPEHQLKFVVQSASDLDEILALLRRLPPVRPDRVLLMPEGRTAVEAAGRAPVVAALCSRHGFRYTPRLHLDLFGGGRGV
jgi:7-carboxy-7-deazaguanine synthase